MRVLACADKFRGTLDSVAFGAAVEEGAAGHEVTVQPMADGGEGTLDAFGGENRTTLVTGPLGTIVEAGWSLSRGRAVIEMAAASGPFLSLSVSTKGCPVVALKVVVEQLREQVQNVA